MIENFFPHFRCWCEHSAESRLIQVMGYSFCRTSHDADWETCVSIPDFEWKQIAEPVMQLYAETTDGSTIEARESALVWNYQHADPDFGSCQAKELLDHLESVLANEPVSVKSGQHIVEVKPQVSGIFPLSSALIFKEFLQ